MYILCILFFTKKLQEKNICKQNASNTITNYVFLVTFKLAEFSITL